MSYSVPVYPQRRQVSIVTGWSGLYEVSPDDCGIIGKVTQLKGHLQGRVWEAHSFSGHGVMQSYGVGLALSEKIVKGRF
jgi:glycine/D-amino acid oxidase-like deaminating enzyme